MYGLGQSLGVQVNIRIVEIWHSIFQVVSSPECAGMCPDGSEEFGIFAAKTRCPKTPHRMATNGPTTRLHVKCVCDVLSKILNNKIFVFLFMPFAQASRFIQVEIIRVFSVREN